MKTAAELALERAECDDALLRGEKCKRRDVLWEEVERLETKLREQLETEFAERERRAKERVARAQEAVDAERLESASNRAPYPIGTLLFEWEPIRWTHDWRRTGKTGRIEVFAKDGAFPSKLKWRRPAVGDIIIRHLKKDGEPGMMAEAFTGWRTENWLPEGEKPKDG